MKALRQLALAALLALAPALALSAPVRPQPHKLTLGASQVALRVPFSAPGCYASGSALGTKGEAVTTVRASTATYTDAAGAVQTCAANQLRVAPQGALIEPAATNVTLQSEALNNASWGQFNVSVTADQAPFVTGASTMDLITTTGADGGVYQASTVSSSTGPFTGSIWTRAVSGSSAPGINVKCGTGNATSCSCTRSDGVACPSAATSAYCTAWPTVSTTPVRVSVITSCTLAATSIEVSVGGGQRLVATGSAYFGGAQLETGPVATSYIATAGTSASRAADVVSVASVTTGPRLGIVATVTPASTTAPAGRNVAQLYNGAADRFEAYVGAASGVWSADYYNGADQAFSSAYAVDAAAQRVGFFTDGAAVRVCKAGVCASSAKSFTPSSSFSTLYVGGNNAGTQIGGYVSDLRVCKVGQLKADCQ